MAQKCYGAATEKALLKRLMNYREAYFAWVTNFDLPFTNNVSERALRGVKSKMKISEHFQNITADKNYATIRSCGTYHRHGGNPVEALERLMQGTPVTLQERLAGSAENEKNLLKF